MPSTIRPSSPVALPIRAAEPRDPEPIAQRKKAAAVRPGAASLARLGRNAQATIAVKQQKTSGRMKRPKAQVATEKAEDKHRRPSTHRPRVQKSQAPLLDARQNVPVATVRESCWALKVWKKLTIAHEEEFLEHLAFLTETARQNEGAIGIHRSTLEPTTLAAIEIGFKAATDLDEWIEEWQENPSRTSMQLCELLLVSEVRGEEEFDFKALIDGLQNYIFATDPNCDRSARQRAFFTDRGRLTVERNKRRFGSDRNRHAGIADSDNRPPRLDNVFAQPLRHFKGYTARDPRSAIAQAFKRSGTPYIGGASGTIDGLLMLTNRAWPLTGLDAETKKARIRHHERLICLYSASLISCGHHSLMECLLPAQAYGYFKRMPDPLSEGYAKTIDYLTAHLKRIGIGAKRLTA